MPENPPPTTRIAPTNEAVAALIGLTHSTVSRIRAGHRFPSIPAMSRIQTVYGWTVQEQVDARGRGADAYATEFERVIAGGPLHP